MRSTAGPVTSTSRNAWTGSHRSTRSSCKSCGSSREHATRPVWLEHSGRNPARLATHRSRGCLMSSGYEVARIDELEELPIAGGEFVWRPIRRRFGITAFGTNAYADKGDLEQARTLFADLLHEHPDAWQGFFNAACLEARVGDKDQAIEHFQRAVELEPEKAREFARTDSDFDSIRDDPRFASLVSGEPDSSG